MIAPDDEDVLLSQTESAGHHPSLPYTSNGTPVFVDEYNIVETGVGGMKMRWLGVLWLLVLFCHATARTVYEWKDDNLAVQGGLESDGGREPASSSLVRSSADRIFLLRGTHSALSSVFSAYIRSNFCCTRYPVAKIVD